MHNQPWTNNRAPVVRRPYVFLDNMMLLAMIVAGLTFLAGVGIIMVDGDPGGGMAAGSGLVVLVLSGIGRVVIGMARTLEDVGENVRAMRGFEEFRMRQQQ